MAPPVSKLQLEVLLAICQTLHKALDLDQALEDILGVLSEKLSMQRATITLVDRVSGRLVISASYGLTPEEKRRGVYRLDEGVTGRIFQSGQPYYAPDIRREPLFLDKTGARRIAKGRISFLGVPIILSGEPMGVLNVDRLFGDSVAPEEDIRFLIVVATLMAQVISLADQVREREEGLRRENVSLKSLITRQSSGLAVVGVSHAMQEVQRLLEKVAVTKASVLLLGESGTGKTLIARLIHDLSERRAFPLVKVNCASIPGNLLETELFGHERGAFTGAAAAKAGRFEDAHRGTIFLDEIGELDLSLQAKLLHVLQDREFERIGGNRTIKVDVRLIAATNRDLATLVEQGQFRADLYYRLNVFPIHAPPLRERREDILGLLNHFAAKVAKEYGRTLQFTASAVDALRNYNWPGNVREMENLVERLAIMAPDTAIGPELIAAHLDAPGRESSRSRSPGEAPPCSARKGPTLREMEKAEVVFALRRHGFIQNRAAAELGITPRQMSYRIRKYGLMALVFSERHGLDSKG